VTPGAKEDILDDALRLVRNAVRAKCDEGVCGPRLPGTICGDFVSQDVEAAYLDRNTQPRQTGSQQVLSCVASYARFFPQQVGLCGAGAFRIGRKPKRQNVEKQPDDGPST
jgi:hypothetical protein